MSWVIRSLRIFSLAVAASSADSVWAASRVGFTVWMQVEIPAQRPREKRPRRPELRFAGAERIALDLIGRHHQALVECLEHELAAGSRPPCQAAAVGGNLRLAARTRERPN